MRRVVAVGTCDVGTSELQARVCKLERRVRILTVVMVLLLTVIRIARLNLTNTRVCNPGDRARLLRAIGRSEGVLPKRSALRIVGLSSTRYGQWNRRDEFDCPLDDRSQCPRARPGQLTPQEVREMREMATALEYRHVPTSTLAILAQRLGKVFASASSWCKYVRERGWRRPRRRVHPRSPAAGIRATAPNGQTHAHRSRTAFPGSHGTGAAPPTFDVEYMQCQVALASSTAAGACSAEGGRTRLCSMR